MIRRPSGNNRYYRDSIRTPMRFNEYDHQMMKSIMDVSVTIPDEFSERQSGSRGNTYTNEEEFYR